MKLKKNFIIFLKDVWEHLLRNLENETRFPGRISASFIHQWMVTLLFIWVFELSLPEYLKGRDSLKK